MYPFIKNCAVSAAAILESLVAWTDEVCCGCDISRQMSRDVLLCSANSGDLYMRDRVDLRELELDLKNVNVFWTAASVNSSEDRAGP